jgi:fucose permease
MSLSMTQRRRSGFVLIGLAYLAFVSLGLPDGLIGVAWPSIRAYFNLPLDSLGLLLVMFTAGYLVSSFVSGRLLSVMSVGTLLALSCLATAVSLIGNAIAPAWLMIVTLAIVAGLGAGAIDAGLNTFAATQLSARMVNWLHACYGVGAATGPLIMTRVLAARHPWQRGYAIVGGWQLALALCFLVTRRLWPSVSSTSAQFSAKVTRASNISTLKLPAVWLSVAVFFVYTGIEAAAGTWAYSLFTEARGVSMMTAGAWVSIYWGGLTAGRLLSGVVVGFVPAHRLVRWCIIGIALGAGLIWSNLTNNLSFLGLGLMGLASAPVFPSVIAATPGRLGPVHTANGVGFQIAGAVLGQSLLPTLIGLMARKLGLEIVGPALLFSALVLAGLYLSLTVAGPAVGREMEVTA